MVEAQQADVIVVGGGIAGMIAAVRCGQRGLRPVVLERLTDDRYVCNSRLTGGVFHLALNDIRKPQEELAQAVMDATGNTADPTLAKLLARSAKPVVDWLQSLGIRFVRGTDLWQTFVLAPPGIAALGRQWQGRAGDVLLRTLEARLTELGGKVLRGHEAQRLVMEAGRCAGVEVKTLNGAATFRSRAVLLADGGFQSNKEQLARHISPKPEEVVQRNAGTGLGIGLRMAREVGAATSDLGSFYGHVLSRDALKDDSLWPYPWLDELLKYYIVVGDNGRRFADEGRGGVYIANMIARRSCPASTFVICDEEGWQTAGQERFLPPNPNFEKAGATLLRASSLRDVAALAGIDADALEAEVAGYNAAIDAGALQGLTPARSTSKVPARPIRRGPFYALPAAAGITYTMGGILIDGQARVLDHNRHPIPGLYAAGSTTGGIEGGPNTGYVGGLVKASTTGFAFAEGLAV